MNIITIGNREIALMAFDRLRKEDKTDSGDTAVRRRTGNGIQVHGVFSFQPEYGDGKGKI